MRIVTLENFRNWTPNSDQHPGCVYKGDAYLFRFTIQSPEHFFRDQLHDLLRTLGADISSVYRVLMIGSPGIGLYEVHLTVSFQRRPKETKLELLRRAVPPSDPLDHPSDQMERLLYGILKDARQSTKKNLAQALEREKQDAKAGRYEVRRQDTIKSGGRMDVVFWDSASKEGRSGKSVRLHFHGVIPDEAGWNDVNFLLSELLRDEFNPKNITRLEFWAKPDMEEANDRVEAEVFIRGAVRLHAIRAKPKRSRLPHMDGPKITSGTGEVVQFSVCEPFDDLSEEDRMLLVGFNRLPLQGRIRFWQKHMAPHFK